MEIHIGEVYWSDDEPEVYGERLTFDDLKSIGPDEIVLVEDDAEVEPYGAVAARLESLDDVCARFNRGTSKLIVIGREDMIEPYDEEHGDFAVVWRIRNADAQEDAPEIKKGGSMEDHAGEEIMLTEKQQAEALHKQITGYGEVIYQSLYGMCTAIKQMRDSKLYKALGYDTFEAYTEEKLGMKRRQAYNYIQIADQLTEDFVQPVAQIGMRKLLMLAALTDDERAEIVQNTNLTETTIRELKAQIAALQSQNADTEKARADAEERAQKWYDEAESKGRQLTENHAKLVKSEERNGRLQEQIDELENRPVEVAVPEPSHEVQNLQDAMRRINAEQEAYNAKVENEHFKQVQEIHAKHRAETDALRAEYEEKLVAAQASPAEAPDSKEVFKVYLAAVIDAAKRMMAFLSAHPDAACKAQAEKAFQTMLQEVNNEQAV